MGPNGPGAICALVVLPLLASGCSRDLVTGERELIFISPQQIAIGRELVPQFKIESGRHGSWEFV